MHNNQRQSSIYNSLISSVGELHNVTESIKKAKGVLSSFTDYLNQNEAEISKFGKASGELCSFLNNYDFSKGFLQIEPMHRKVEALHPLRLKLAKMGEEAKKLAVFPDRYGSKKAIEVCRGLAMTCMERMSLEETSRVSDLVETNTGKLLELQKKFDGDGYILDQIKDEVDANKCTLNKFKAYSAELQQYVGGFPHAGEDNLTVVKMRIEVAKQIESLINNVGKTIETINSYCDRYNKSKVVGKYATVVNDTYLRMRFADVEKYKSQLNDVAKQAQSVIGAFDDENRELVQLQSALMRRNPDMWREDNENITDTIDSLLAKDSRKAAFSIKQLRDRIDDAKSNRNDYIGSMVKRYGWLTRKNYKGLHDNLITEYLSLSEYKSSIEAMRKEHSKRVWKGIGLGIGIPVGIAVAIYAIYVIALIALGFIILKFLLKSHDD